MTTPPSGQSCLLVIHFFLLFLQTPKVNFSKLSLEEQKDSKTLLQEFLQSLGKNLPEYKTIEKNQHGEIYFISSVALPDHNVTGSGEGKSKKLAEQIAASEALKILSQNEK